MYISSYMYIARLLHLTIGYVTQTCILPPLAFLIQETHLSMIFYFKILCPALLFLFQLQRCVPCFVLLCELCLSKTHCTCFTDISIAVMSSATLCNKLFKEFWYSNMIFLYLAATRTYVFPPPQD